VALQKKAAVTLGEALHRHAVSSLGKQFTADDLLTVMGSRSLAIFRASTRRNLYPSRKNASLTPYSAIS
jgi:hypothetical protein